MKRIGMCVLLIAVAGCGFQPNAGRLLPGINLVEVCEEFGRHSVAELESILIAFENDRLDGFTWSELRTGAAFTCYRSRDEGHIDSSMIDSCLNCNTAIVDQVFGVGF